MRGDSRAGSTFSAFHSSPDGERGQGQEHARANRTMIATTVPAAFVGTVPGGCDGASDRAQGRCRVGWLGPRGLILGRFLSLAPPGLCGAEPSFDPGGRLVSGFSAAAELLSVAVPLS